MNHRKKAIRGVTWMGSLRIFTRLLAFVRIAIVARILTPEQFGIFGIAALVLSFLEVSSETGINAVLIQQKTKFESIINSAWVVSVVRGVLISAAIFLLAPVASTFFNSPESSSSLYIVALVPLFRGLINPSIISLQRDLKFQKEFALRISLFFVDSAVVVIFAILTQRAESLVLGLLAAAIVEAIISHTLITPRPIFKYERKYLKKIFRRGKWITSWGLMSFLSDQGDDIVVGRMLGTASLGFYTQMYKISILPLTEIAHVFAKAMFPFYSKLSGDSKMLKRMFLETTVIASVITIFMGIFIFAFSEPIIKVILGEQWVSQANLLRILAVFGVVRSVVEIPNSFLLSRIRQRQISLITFVRFVALAIFIFPMINLFGLEGAGYAAIISVVIPIPLMIVVVKRELTV